MGFRLFALLLCLTSMLSFAQQDAPPLSDHGESAATKPSEAPKLDLTPDARGQLSQQQMQQLFRIVADKDMENEKRQRDYTYVERDVQNNLDGKGNTKSIEIKTYEVLEIYGEQVQKLIEKNDQPLDAHDAAKEDTKLEKIIDKRKNESEGERKKRLEKEEKEREQGRKFVTEVADAYIFKLVGSEQVGGRDAWVIDVEGIRAAHEGIQVSLQVSRAGLDRQGRSAIVED